MGPSILSTGKRVVDVTRFESWFKDVHDRMVGNPLVKAGRADQPGLGVIDRKVVVVPEGQGPVCKSVSNFTQFKVEVRCEPLDIRATSLTSDGLPESEFKI